MTEPVTCTKYESNKDAICYFVGMSCMTHSVWSKSGDTIIEHAVKPTEYLYTPDTTSREATLPEHDPKAACKWCDEPVWSWKGLERHMAQAHPLVSEAQRLRIVED